MNQELGSLKIIGESPAWTALTEKLPRIARSSASVLIQGETGTGKELCARAIHALSPRAGYPFIPVNCGALPLELIENELFGHEAGAFTSATASARGLISEADGGTLFLDEIDSLPLVAQVKLLRFLQEKEFKPLGSKKTLKANVRVLAATNADLPGTSSRWSAPSGSSLSTECRHVESTRPAEPPAFGAENNAANDKK